MVREEIRLRWIYMLYYCYNIFGRLSIRHLAHTRVAGSSLRKYITAHHFEQDPSGFLKSHSLAT
jgi:hypothetical protein